MGEVDDGNILELGSQKITKSLRARCGWKEGAGGGELSEWSFSMQIAFYCEEMEHASAMAEKLKDDAVPVAFTFQPRIFFFCLIAVRHARDNKIRRKPFTKEAQKYFEMVQEWVVERKCINMAHKLLILDAEMRSLNHELHKGRLGSSSAKARNMLRKQKNPENFTTSNTKNEELKAAYDRAIAASTRAGFLQDGALAAQLASNALPDQWVVYFEQAQELYGSWGAKGVVKRLSQQRHHLSTRASLILSQEERSSQGYKSRERFDGSLADEHKALDIGERDL
jgi:hypothetical protein